jgi:hypothetical protein
MAASQARLSSKNGRQWANPSRPKRGKSGLVCSRLSRHYVGAASRDEEAAVTLRRDGERSFQSIEGCPRSEMRRRNEYRRWEARAMRRPSPVSARLGSIIRSVNLDLRERTDYLLERRRKVSRAVGKAQDRACLAVLWAPTNASALAHAFARFVGSIPMTL